MFSFISGKKLNTLLQGNQESKTSVFFHHTGPGNLDVGGLLRGETDVWVNYETKSEQKKPKPMVILCYPYFKLAAKNDFDLALFIAFFREKYEVFVWTGEERLFSTQKPLADMEELWTSLPKMQASNKKELLKILSQQGIPADMVYVLDLTAYRFLFESLMGMPLTLLTEYSYDELVKELFLMYTDDSTHHFTNKDTNEDNTTESSSIQVFQGLQLGLPPIKKVEFKNFGEEQWKKLAKLLPPLEHLGILDNRTTKAPHCFDIFAKTIRSLYFEKLDLQTFHFERFTGLEKLKLISCKGVKNEYFSLLNNLKSLTLEGIDCPTLDLSSCEILEDLSIESISSRSLVLPENLKKLKLRNLTFLRSLTLGSQLEEIEIHGCMQLRLNNNTLPLHCKKLKFFGVGKLNVALHNLEELDIYGDKIDFNIAKFSLDLRELKISNSKKIKTLDLSRFTALEKIGIVGCDNLEELTFPYELKALEIKGDNNYLSALKDTPLLEELYITSDYKVMEMVLPPLQHLSQLFLKNISNLNLNFSNHLALQSLDIILAWHLVNLTLPPHLKILKLHALALKELDLRSCKYLEVLELSYLNIDTLLLPSSLKKIRIETCTNLSELDLNHCHSLRELVLFQTNINSLDYSDCEKLITIDTGEAQANEQESSILPNIPLDLPNNTVAAYEDSSEETTIGVYHKRDKAAVIKGSLQVMVFKDGKAVDVDLQRAIITNTLDYQPRNSTLVFKTDFSNEHLTVINIPIKTVATEFSRPNKGNYGLIKGPIGEKWFALPMLSSSDALENCVANTDRPQLEFCFSKELDQYLVRSRKGVIHLELLYFFNELKANKTQKKLMVSDKLLPLEFIKRLQNELQNIPKLSFLLSPHIKIEDKVQKLKAYCKFRNEALSRQPKNSIEEFFLTIIERKGACQQRALAAFALLRFCGIEARGIANSTHYRIEIPYQAGLETVWEILDLGGAPDPFLHPDEGEFLKKFKAKEEASVVLPALVNQYDSILAAYLEPKEISSTADLLKEKNPLILLKGGENPLLLSEKLRATLGALPFFYIDSKEDLDYFLTALEFKNNYFQAKTDGPLIQVITEKNLLLVNWSGFSANEIATYKSLLDNSPTLNGKPVNVQCTIVGLMQADKKPSEDFLTRCRLLTVNEKFLNQAIAVKPSPLTNHSDFMQVSLFGLEHDWEEILLGRPMMKGKYFQDIPGALFQALERGCRLIISEPPLNNRKFDLLLHRLTVEKRFFHNGRWYNLPDNFIELNQNPIDYEFPANVTFLTSLPTQRHLNYLTLDNHIDFLRGLRIENRQASDTEGLFADEYTNVIVIADTIPKGYWQHLMAAIKKRHDKKTFQFFVLPGYEIEGVYKNPAVMQERDSNEAPIIVSNDVDYCVRELQHSIFKDKTVHVAYLSPKSSLNDTIHTISIEKTAETSQFHFDYQQHDILTKLIEGDTVILSGNLSVSFYKQLQPLLAKQARFYCNGAWQEIKGELKIVLSEKQAARLNLQSIAYKNYSFEDYKSVFRPGKTLNDMALFLKLASKIPHKGLAMPSDVRGNQARIQNLLTALETSSQKNPLKQVFHFNYETGSEEFAYLSTLSRILFAKKSNCNDFGFNAEKLQRLFNRLSLSSVTREKSWFFLNCLSANGLDYIFSREDIQDFERSNRHPPAISDKAWRKLTQLFDQQKVLISKSPLESLFFEEKETTHDIFLTKPYQEIRRAVFENTPFIFIKGPPGVGKTTMVRKILAAEKITCYESMNKITEWLLDESPHKKVLLLDEANISQNGELDFLKGMVQGRIYYQGRFYKLSEHHQVVFTGNPEYFPGRYYHDFIQDYGKIIYIKAPKDDFLARYILKPLLLPKNHFNEQVVKALLFAYHNIQAINPTAAITLRDLENLTIRFLYLSKKDSTEKALFNACLGEFAYGLEDREKRKLYAHALLKELQQAPEPTKGNQFLGFYFPKTRASFLDVLRDDLELLLHQESDFARKGILIEGPSGVGKSTLFEAMLQAQGLTQDNLDTQNKYYLLTAGSSNTFAVLEQAFHEGAKVILDELNLDENLEVLLNQLLTGVDSKGNSPLKPGFALFASQNPGYFKGRKLQSLALQNRLHKLYFDEYNRDELIDIASHHRIKEPEKFVDAFLKLKSQHSHINMRNFFESVKAVKATTPVEPKLSVQQVQIMQQELTAYLHARGQVVQGKPTVNITSSLFRQKELTKKKLLIASNLSKELKPDLTFSEVLSKIENAKKENFQTEKAANKTYGFFTQSGLDRSLNKIERILNPKLERN